jgi:hypothetical protein
MHRECIPVIASEAKQSNVAPCVAALRDSFVASLLAMTSKG